MEALGGYTYNASGEIHTGERVFFVRGSKTTSDGAVITPKAVQQTNTQQTFSSGGVVASRALTKSAPTLRWRGKLCVKVVPSNPTAYASMVDRPIAYIRVSRITTVIEEELCRDEFDI
jgi:hypothetical protein